MYIRRKVFSLLEVDEEERIFSLNEEKLFARIDYEGLDDT